MTSETENEAPRVVTPKIDVVFPASGGPVPLDHGYALFGALAGHLGDLHGAEWLAVAPLHGVPRGEGMIALRSGHGALRLRIAPERIANVLSLAGASLDVRGASVLLGASREYVLKPAPTLSARAVVIKGFMEEAPMREAVERQLTALNVRARVEVKRRRVLTIAGKRVVGFGVVLYELDADASLRVQYAGVGGRQRFGCGVFTVPPVPR